MPRSTIEQAADLDFTSLGDFTRRTVCTMTTVTLMAVIEDLTRERSLSQSDHEQLLLTNLINRYTNWRIEVTERENA